MGRENCILKWRVKEEVYGQPTRGLVDQIVNIMSTFEEALYGLKKAPRAWYDTLSKFLLHRDFFLKGVVDPNYINLSPPKKQLEAVKQVSKDYSKKSTSGGTFSSLQYLAKDFSFGDHFFNDKPLEANNEKATTDTEAESMVSVTIHQDISVIPPMTSSVIDLVSVPDSPTMHRPLLTTTAATATTTTTTIMKTIPLPPQP
ncbi:hypothetical protein Tco_0828693 [Tanacetum coccineum]